MSNRVMIGEHDTLGYGLYVAKPTKDATSATGNDLIFDSSSIATSMLHQIVDITITSGNSSGTGAITGLAYIPYINFSEYDSNGVRGLRYEADIHIGAGGMGGTGRHNIKFTHWRAYTTSTTITITTWPTDSYYNNAATTNMVFPNNTGYDFGGTTVNATKYFRCFVYRIPAV